ncbi:MAG: acetyl-CoA carboxylase biotin carboxyl carrier protein [Campylobacteraceae bacterium]|jgi:acetyl-CoA carboxylase biotin carboxyl carrier protein|nr:acetyl-CoA carboxylase biotin carboxyl carrier protein [Campylobacteraceae bacterium]
MLDKDVRELLKIFDKSNMSKLKIKQGDFEIELKKNGGECVYSTEEPKPITTTQIVNTQVEQKAIENRSSDVISNASTSKHPTFKSPMVGTFYKSPSPGAEAFVKIGSVVKKGQSIAIIEAMKIMNEIDAEYDCRIVDILVEDGQPVEFEMPLFSVERV